MAFGNLTVDFRQLARVPVRDRAALAQSAQASEIFGNLTPSQIASLFPDYYKKFIPQATGSGSMAAGLTGAGTTTGTGTSTSTSTATSAGPVAPTAPAGPTRPGFIQELLGTAVSESTVPLSGEFNVKDRRSMIKGTYDAFIRAGYTDKQARALVAEVGRENSFRAGIMFGEHAEPGRKHKGRTNSGIFSMAAERRDGLLKYMSSQGLLNPDGRTFPATQESLDAMARYARLEMSGDPNAPISPGQLKAAQKFLAAADADQQEAGKYLAGWIAWDIAGRHHDAGKSIQRRDSHRQEIDNILIEAQTAQPLPGTAPIDPTMPTSDTGIIPLGQGGTTATVTPQLQAFDPAIFAQLDPRIQEYYKTATDDEKKQLESAISKLGTSGVQEIMQRHPKATAEAVTGKVIAENMDTASNVSDMVNQDPLAFWKQRNPQGAKIDDLDVETLRTSMMAAMKLEADAAAQGKPKKVEIYGGESGVRYNPSKPGSRHGVNFKEALDIAIYDVDPNTGQKLKTKSGAYGNYSNKPNHGGIDPEGFALYHEFGQNAELARVYLANQGDTNYQNWALRQGGLFGDVEWDFMHVDRSSTPGKYGVSAHANPGSRGSVAYGYTETALRELGIDPNSDAGRRLMTGVIERFGGETPSKEAIAEAAQKAFGQKPQPKLSEDTAKIVQAAPEQPLPGTEAQTQQQRPNDTDTINLKQSQGQAAPTANTAPAMKLGGEMDFKEPNTVKESMSLVANGKEVAQFNKNEQVNVEDGKIKVQNEYDKRTKESQQRNDKGAPQANQYNMRQSPANEMPRTFPDQVKYGIVPQSPSAKRQFETAQFGGYDHFSRRSHSA